MIKRIILMHLVIGTLVLAVVSCSGMEWDRPSSKYRECLRENQHDSSVCDHYKEAYEKKIDSKRRQPDVQHGDGGMYEK